MKYIKHMFRRDFYAHTHTHTYTYTQIHIHTNNHTPARARARERERERESESDRYSKTHTYLNTKIHKPRITQFMSHSLISLYFQAFYIPYLFIFECHHRLSSLYALFLKIDTIYRIIAVMISLIYHRYLFNRGVNTHISTPPARLQSRDLVRIVSDT